MRLLAPTISLLAVLVLAAPAMAQDEVIAPPGNSGVEEYLEVVPGAGGDKPANGAKGGNTAAPSPAAALGSGNAKALEAKGSDGKAAAAAAAAGSPTDRKTARQREKADLLGDAATGTSIAASPNSGDRATSVARALGGDGGGMGVLFPILLGLTLSLALALGIGRLLRRG